VKRVTRNEYGTMIVDAGAEFYGVIYPNADRSWQFVVRNADGSYFKVRTELRLTFAYDAACEMLDALKEGN
jgi:hypothetical protein